MTFLYKIERCYTSVITYPSLKRDSSLQPVTWIGPTRRLSASELTDLARKARPQTQLARTVRPQSQLTYTQGDCRKDHMLRMPSKRVSSRHKARLECQSHRSRLERIDVRLPLIAHHLRNQILPQK
ncbi:hypothetical protein J1N35_017172 [Gossypium stocksii]|uniref:Uncharacterized protein n=1 Tax=Gossypium stocksii TaxID=47602 RepID=A0A9D3VNS3_9ROSI|nr:hypothetical protein J1N35_017172 [Gossypium stocksii]